MAKKKFKCTLNTEIKKEIVDIFLCSPLNISTNLEFYSSLLWLYHCQ